jgi:hypothetical protein
MEIVLENVDQVAYVDFGNVVGMKAGFVQVMCQHFYRIIFHYYEIEAFFDESVFFGLMSIIL